MAATDGETAFVELMQLQTGSGPCMDCYRTGRARSIPDITAERERWPRLITAMTGAGYRCSGAEPSCPSGHEREQPRPSPHSRFDGAVLPRVPDSHKDRPARDSCRRE